MSDMDKPKLYYHFLLKSFKTLQIKTIIQNKSKCDKTWYNLTDFEHNAIVNELI